MARRCSSCTAFERAVLVGHSMGAAVAQRVAADHPQRVRGLVLLGAFASLADNAAVRELWDTAVSCLADPFDPAFVRAFQAGTAARPLPPALLDLAVRESLAVPAHVWRALFAGFLADDGAERLHRIAATTVVGWGDQDAICRRADQDALVAAIPGARLQVLRGIGHSVHWEVPAVVPTALRALEPSAAGAR